MKKHLISLYSLLVLLGIASCDFLEKEPDDMKTDTMIWKSRVETEKYLYNVYSQMPMPLNHNDAPWLGLSDEVDLTWNVYPTYNINLGNWNPNTNYYNRWPSYYKAIRASFVFENNVDKCPELSDALKIQYKAEAKFLRGFYYWTILKQYGPAVLIKEELPASYDWNNFPRASYDECVEYIVELMEDAERDLPMHWQNDRQWFGKPTKIACKAVKAEALLFAASPQWNGNKEYANFRNKDGKLLANVNYDESRWKRAADASLDLIRTAESNPDANVKLYKNNENGDGTVFNPYKSVRDVLLKRWNCEIIFGRAGFDQNAWEVHCSPGTYNLGGVAPTQRVVDAFLMKNGKSIYDAGSGYVEEGFAAEGHENWNPQNLDLKADRVRMIEQFRSGDAWGHWPGDWNMYANREPRFYAFVLYNGRPIPQLPPDIDKRNYFSTKSSVVDQQDGYGRVELYYGGFSRGSGASTFFPRTGYLVLKNVDPQSNMRDRVYVNVGRQFTYYRYAAVLLDYIEALNEYDPNHPDIEKYWNMIRERAGVPGVFVTNPEIKGNKDQQRERILQERQIELCFEGDRYHTTRRRWLSHTPDTGTPDDYKRKYGDGGRFWGMDINAGNPSTNSFAYTGFYQRVAFETRVYDWKNALFPIPQTEIDKNAELVQNPGW